MPPHQSSEERRAAFLSAVKTQKLSTLKWSLSHGGQKPSHRDDMGYTSLHIAAKNNATKSLRILCDFARRGDKEALNCTTGDDNQLTALMIGARLGFQQVCQELLYANCNHNIKCANNRTAADYARRHGHDKLAVIIENGGDELDDDNDFEDEDEALSDDAPEGETSTQRSRRKKRELKLKDEQRFGSLTIDGNGVEGQNEATNDDDDETEEVEDNVINEDQAKWQEVRDTLKSMKTVNNSRQELVIERCLASREEEIDPLLWNCTCLNNLSIHITREKDNDDEGKENCETVGISVVPNGLSSLVNLLTLILNNNGISKLPDTIGNLQQLRCLEIANNNFSSLPDTFSSLSNLETLNVSCNKFTNLDQYVNKLENIVNLSADDNEIESIDGFNWKKKTRLGSLSICSNKIKCIPEDIQFAKQLNRLLLINNKVETMPPTLANCKKLQVLRMDSTLKDNKINKMLKKHSDDDASLMKELIPYLKKMAKKK